LWLAGKEDPMQIVKLGPEEWQAFRQLRLESLEADPQAFSSLYAEVERRPDSFWQERLRESQVGEKSWMLFARDGDRLVGMIGAFREAGSEMVEIISVYVSRDWRGQGVGGALMEGILGEMRRLEGVRTAVLGVNAGQAAAVALYQRFGFVIVGENSGVMGDGSVHKGYVMEKNLREEEKT
jgi:ribosomal protein S18 acetylase RimI-like enzyme